MLNKKCKKMKKIISLFCLAFLGSLALCAEQAMSCQKRCPDSGKTIMITPCQSCLDGEWDIDCDGNKLWCPGHDGGIPM